MSELIERLKEAADRLGYEGMHNPGSYADRDTKTLDGAIATILHLESRVKVLESSLEEGLAAAELVGISDSYDTLLEAKRKTVVWSVLVAQKSLTPPKP